MSSEPLLEAPKQTETPSSSGFIRDQKDFWAGAVFVAIGVFALIGLRDLSIGTATQMGPGYFPMLVGLLLVGLGSIAMVTGARASDRTEIGRWPLVPTILICFGAVLFAVFIARFGLAVAVLALILLSCGGRIGRHPIELLAIYAALCAVSWFIFIWMLQLPVVMY